MTVNTTWTSPAAAGTLDLANGDVATEVWFDAMVSNFGFLGGVAGLTSASQAEQEAGSVTTAYTTPGRQQYHPSAAKAWGRVALSGGVPTLSDSYNVTSVTDNGVGLLQVVIATDFSSANYTVVLGLEYTRGVDDLGIVEVNNGTGGAAKAVGTFDVVVTNLAGNLHDSYDSFFFACFGDQ